MFTWSTSGSDVIIFILTLVGVIEAAQHKVDADPRVHACKGENVHVRRVGVAFP